MNERDREKMMKEREKVMTRCHQINKQKESIS